MRISQLVFLFVAGALILVGCDSAPSASAVSDDAKMKAKTNRGGPPAVSNPNVAIETAIAPNIFCGSLASYQDWAENAVFERTSDGPDSFEPQNAFAPGNFIVTSFSSWLAQADPEQTFGPAFETECGNRVAWVTRITAPEGETVDVDDGYSFKLVPNAYRPNGYDFTIPFFYNTLGQYSVVGLDYGADGEKGTSDDEVKTWQDCNDNSLSVGIFDVGQECPEVNEIVGVLGLGSAPNPNATGTDQEKINAVYDYIANLKNGAITFKTEATFNGGKPTKDTAVLTGQARGAGVTGVKPQNNDALMTPPSQ